jgi:hypothetical protein
MVAGLAVLVCALAMIGLSFGQTCLHSTFDDYRALLAWRVWQHYC